MTLLLEMKEKCKQIYANYGYVILPVVKFILAMSIFYSINLTLNFAENANNIFVLLIMALICCVAPLGITVCLGIGLIIFQCYSVGIEVAGFALALIALLFIFYVRFTPDDAIVLLLTPMAFLLGIPCVIPIGYGLVKKPSAGLSAGCGVIVYYFIMLVQQKASVLQATTGEELNISKNLQILIDSMLNNTDLLVNLVAFVAVMLTVYLIRRLSVDYAWQIAIFTGAVMYIIIWVLAAMVMDVACKYLTLILGTIISVVILEIFAFFRFGVDYSRTEYHQFEDDDYYYYVKAVPKVKITEKNVTVKRIHEKEPEVVVEEVKTYKPTPRPEASSSSVGGNTSRIGGMSVNTPFKTVSSDVSSVSGNTNVISNRSGVTKDTIAYNPVSRGTSGDSFAEEVKEPDNIATANLKTEQEFVNKQQVTKQIVDDNFQQQLEKSLKNL